MRALLLITLGFVLGQIAGVFIGSMIWVNQQRELIDGEPVLFRDGNLYECIRRPLDREDEYDVR